MVIWERPEPSAPSALSRERIVRAAIRLADADGLAAVSLRKIAAALDVGPMRLYRYVDTKDDLLALMMDAVWAEIPVPALAEWRAGVRALAGGIRAAALRHEWFADLLGGRPDLGPAAFGHMEARVAALRAAPGLRDDADALALASRAVGAYVLGALRHEIADRRAERASGLTEHQWQAAAGPYVTRMMATGRYPTLAHLLTNAADQDPEAAFDSGLAVVLDGISGRLPESDG